jgi:hypothetical protein
MHAPKPAAKRKPRPPKAAVDLGKLSTPIRMKNPLPTEVKKFTPEQAVKITASLKEAMEAVHVCEVDRSTCKHD